MDDLYLNGAEFSFKFSKLNVFVFLLLFCFFKGRSGLKFRVKPEGQAEGNKAI